MFSIDNIDFGFFLWLYHTPTKRSQYYRSLLNEHAVKYGIQHPELVKTKQHLLEMILNLWEAEFRKHPEFKEAYEERWSLKFSLPEIEWDLFLLL